MGCSKSFALTISYSDEETAAVYLFDTIEEAKSALVGYCKSYADSIGDDCEASWYVDDGCTVGGVVCDTDDGSNSITMAQYMVGIVYN